jgi:hypothetical protein
MLGNLLGRYLDIETCEESGYALIGKAALAQDSDLFIEHGDYLRASIKLLISAGGFAKLAGCCRDLVCGVHSLVCHFILRKSQL